jgi:hypothetical protein
MRIVRLLAFAVVCLFVDGPGTQLASAQINAPERLGIAYPMWNLPMDKCQLDVPVVGSGFDGVCLRELPSLFQVQQETGGTGSIRLVLVNREVDFEDTRDITAFIARPPNVLRVDDRRRPDGGRYFQVSPVTRVGSLGKCAERFFNSRREYDGAAWVYVAGVCNGQSPPAIPRDGAARDSGSDSVGDAVRDGLGVGQRTQANVKQRSLGRAPAEADEGSTLAPRLRAVVPAYRLLNRVKDQYGREIVEFRCGDNAGGFGEKVPDFDGDGFSGCTEYGSEQYAGYVSLVLAEATALNFDSPRRPGFTTMRVMQWTGTTPGVSVAYRSRFGDCFFVAAPRSNLLTNESVGNDINPIAEQLADMISKESNCTTKSSTGFGYGAPVAAVAAIIVKSRNVALMNGGAYLFGSPPFPYIDNAYFPFIYKFDRGAPASRPPQKVLTSRFAIGSNPATFSQFVKDFEAAVGVTRQ